MECKIKIIMYKINISVIHIEYMGSIVKIIMFKIHI